MADGPDPQARRRGPAGFTLVEAAVVTGVAMVLAGALTPMAWRLVDQHKAEQTRAGLRRMWEAMFGARDQNLPSMRADFGFTLIDGVDNLEFLVAPALGPGAGAERIRAFASAPGNPNRAYGWRGPYWHGPVVDGRPADAWGRRVRLRFDQGRAQLVSAGTGAAGQEIRYPEAPVAEAALGATLYLNFSSQSPRRLRATFAFEQLIRRDGRYELNPVREPSPVVHALAAGRAEAEARLIPVGQCTVYIEDLGVGDAPGESKAAPVSASVSGPPPRPPLGTALLSWFQDPESPPQEVEMMPRLAPQAPAPAAPVLPAGRVVQEYSLALLPGEIRPLTVSLP